MGNSGLSLMDIPFYLSNFDNKGKAWAKVIGVIAGEIPKPDHIKINKIAKNVGFAVLDLVGIDLRGIKSRAAGRIIVSVNKSVFDAAKGKESGRKAVILSGVLNQQNGNLVQMIKLKKEQGIWGIEGVKLEDYSRKIYPEFYPILMEAYKNNWVFPKDYDENYAYCGKGHDYLWADNFNDILSAQSEMTATDEANLQWGKTSDDLNIGGSYSSIDALAGGNNTNFGQSESREIDNQNLKTQHVEPVKTNQIVECRNDLIPKSKVFDKLNDLMIDSKVKVSEAINNLKDLEYSHDIDDAIAYCASNLKKYWKVKRRGLGSTGRAFFKIALERAFPTYKAKTKTGYSDIENAMNMFGAGLVDVWANRECSINNNDFLEELIDDEKAKELFIKMIEIVLQIPRDRLVNAFSYASKLGADMYSVMVENPYALCYLDNRLSIEDLDKLAMLYNINIFDKDVIKQRNAVFFHGVMLDSNQSFIGDNTIVSKARLAHSVKVGLYLNKASYQILQSTGYILTEDRLSDLQTFISDNCKNESFALKKQGWSSVGFRSGKMCLPLGVSTPNALEDYIKSGIGISYTIKGINYVSDCTLFRKELSVYNKVYDVYKSVITPDINDEDIEKCIKEFEELKSKEFNCDFKLETRQADAVRLVRHGVLALTGPAGSGKTTTAEALLYALIKLLEIDEDGIVFAAPTGKAANRLKEVVKRQTRTIHSLYGLGVEDYSLQEKSVPAREVRSDIRVLIIDESSMINIDLMYNALLRVDNHTRIFFLGDIEQLPPIGFGKPFANLLRFIPCVVLNVSKRAAENSTIARNNKRIIDTGSIEDLEDGDDFRLIQEENPQNVANLILDVCKYHLGKGTANNFNPIKNLKVLDVDDIQVATPLNKGPWGIKSLNTQLQDIFNPRKQKETYIVMQVGKDEFQEFRLGDRVIHLCNNGKMVRLIKNGDFFDSLEDSMGIMNGDVGRVEGFYKANELNFAGSESEGSLEDMFKKDNENIMYMAVKYKDVDIVTQMDIDFIVFYEFNVLQKKGNCLTVSSIDLNTIDLAYALTVHKLQGSQAKLIVGAILGVRVKGFISKNMIYTLESRAQKGCYIIGDVKGPGSALNEGRKVDQTNMRDSAMDKVIDGE